MLRVVTWAWTDPNNGAPTTIASARSLKTYLKLRIVRLLSMEEETLECSGPWPAAIDCTPALWVAPPRRHKGLRRVRRREDHQQRQVLLDRVEPVGDFRLDDQDRTWLHVIVLVAQ